MHVCLLLDLATVIFLIQGLRNPAAPARRMLCLACLVHLLAVGLHYYFVFAPWFGFFNGHRSMAAIGVTALLDFFGGFWTFFGIMVFVKGVSWVALAFMAYNAVRWLTKPRASGQQMQALNRRSDPV